MSAPTPELSDILIRAVRNGTATMRVMLPGRIERYDAGSQRADVKLLVGDVVKLEGGESVNRPHPVLPSRPVTFPGFGPWRITMPVAAGDACWVLFASSSLDRYLGVGGEVDPADPRHHSINDGVILMGYEPAPETEAPTDAMVLHGTSIKLGGPEASERLAFISELNALRAAYTSHTHLDPVSGSTGTPSAPQATPYPGAQRARAL